ncbi:hypothetical protein [Streptomyces sp. NBC_01363]|uniref:hypothetical protein n=1 Tax=Streptomyces sp. NBC_01363 TaxID=2903840 RepID=UPI00225427BE|nr:hypothetical protein [Streptomyces sp. NBC_01363]MCX4734954.1 hypothetical protein [Streptomyces sp. NBC_01363]
MIDYVRTWATTRRQAREEKVISELRESLDHFRLSQPIPETVEAALRKTARSQWATAPLSILSLITMWLWSGLFFALTWGFSRSLVGFANGLNPPPWDGIVKAVEQAEPIRVGLSLPFFGGAIAVAIGYVVAIVAGIFIMARGLGGAAISHITPGLELAFLPFNTALAVLQMAQIINSCAKADQSVGEERVYAIAGIPRSSASAKRAIQRASRHRAFSRPFSHHGAVLRDHAARVLGRIQKAEEGLFRDPNPALRELATMWLTIAERYIDGRAGELLVEDLSSVNPAKSRLRSALRAALAVVLTVGTVFFTASLDLPQAIEGYVIAGSAVAVLILVYGARAVVELRRR